MVQEATNVQPRHRRRRANLERIVDAATRIVVDEGVEALSIKRVADDADYTPGALYRYFDGKDALLTAVVVRLVERLGGELRALATRATGAPIAQILTQVAAYCEFSKREPNAYALLSRMASEPRVLFEREDEARAIMVALMGALMPLRAAIEGAADAGLLHAGDAARRTLLVYAGLSGVLTLRKQERLAAELIDTDALAMTLVADLLRGWGADGQALAEALTQYSAMETT